MSSEQAASQTLPLGMSVDMPPCCGGRRDQIQAIDPTDSSGARTSHVRPISDGAAAMILCTEKGIAKLGLGLPRALRVRASAMRSASWRDGDDLSQHITRLTALVAYEEAGLGPKDIQLAEAHAAAPTGELVQTENLGLCAEGESGRDAERGEATIGDRIPVNPSGGLESEGHPSGATGIGQIFEIVGQLRGECGARQVQGARFGIQENGGGLRGAEEAVAHVGIFEKMQ